MSSPSQGNDRIFFGPLQSPEKKFAPSDGPRFRTPVRRSTRLSSAMVPLPLFSEQETGCSRTREGTPEEDVIPDEPSVVLASRILSACSNPSPPPSPSLLAQPIPVEAEDAQLVDVSAPSGVSDEFLSTPMGTLLPLDSITEPTAASSPFVLRPSTSTPRHVDQAKISQPDLIAFDSFSTSNASPSHALLAPAPSYDPITHPLPASVDDLLAMSPSPHPRIETQRIDLSEPVPEKESTATPDEEMEVANSLVIEVDPPRPASPPSTEMMLPEETVAELASTSDKPPASEEHTPPLRRSSRPRRSRSSLSQTLVNVSPQPTPARQESIEADAAAPQRQEKPVRKRKLKVTPLLEDKAEGSSSTTPRRLPQAARVQRDLGSLSPMSAAVLTQLLPRSAGESVSRSSTPQPLPSSQEGDVPSIDIAAAPTTPPPSSTAFVFPKLGQGEASTADAPRPKSPLRPFPPPTFGDGSRTPARRVPIDQAVAEGTYSAQKLPAPFGAIRLPNAPSSPVFKRLALDDPARSPAKRVPMSEAVHVPPSSPGKPADKGKGVFQSPVRASSVPLREGKRSGSTESQPLFSRRERGASAEPSTRPPALGRRPLFQKPASADDVSGSGIKPRTVLPFPLVKRVPPSIPEVEEPSPSVIQAATSTTTSRIGGNYAQAQASPAKTVSVLRQPSAGSGSKIPRIGAKPYARPKATVKDDLTTTASKLPTPAKVRATAASKTKPLRIVPIGSSSGSSSDEGNGSSNATAVTPVPALALKPRRVGMAASSSADTAATSAHSASLKRKRDPVPPESGSKTAPVTQSVIVMRKVVPGMFNKGKDITPAAVWGSTAIAPASPAKPTGPIKARSAVGWKRPQQEDERPPPTPAPAATPNQVEEASRAPSKQPSSDPDPPPTPAPPAESVKDSSEPNLPALLPPDDLSITAGAASASERPTQSTAEQSSTRRSTRSRRTTAPSTDVFGSVASTGSTRPLQRRRGPLPSETAGPFAGMSALALKTLTSANTLKNQQQLATIQTEVVRKEGSRPDSPTTRVRSALEKQREERTHQRKERAERRARRSAGSDLVSAASSADEGAVPGAGTGELDAVGDLGDASFLSVDRDADGEPVKHRRGPGDEEDYETPIRSERPVKRGRFEGEDEEKRGREVPEKRVQWDKGLHKTVYLDDTPPKPKWDTKTVPSQKSCLTPAAKALRLDTLGNVLNAEVPLGGLIKENVVVKKFVFDDDVQSEVVVESPAPVAKSTRNKSKKAKS